MAEPRVKYRIVNEHGELVKMEMPPDVFADGCGGAVRVAGTGRRQP